MSLIEKRFVDRIEVVGDENYVQIRRADVVLRDGTEIARSYYRYLLKPGDDISGEEPKVQAVCNAVWDNGDVV